MVQGTIAITDHGWYSFLSARPEIQEVNFWTPSARRAFRADPFSPFLFKLRSPDNSICGFAYFAQYSRLPDWLAWECFAAGNGCESLAAMRARIAVIRQRIRYDRSSESNEIGCIQLVSPVFFPREEWIPQPSDWRPRTQRPTKYDLSQGEGAASGRPASGRPTGSASEERRGDLPPSRKRSPATERRTLLDRAWARRRFESRFSMPTKGPVRSRANTRCRHWRRDTFGPMPPRAPTRYRMDCSCAPISIASSIGATSL